MTKKPYTNQYASGYSAQQDTLSGRNILIESYLPQVKYIAERIASRLPSQVDTGDLIGAGVIGLIDAAEKYDPSRGVLFKTYAELRVRGAILDSLRGLDWVPRSMRKKAREIETAYKELEQEYGRPANEEEVAQKLGLSLLQFQSLLGELQWITIRDSIDEESEDNRSVSIPDNSNKTPLAIYERTEIREHLINSINQLSEKEHQVIALYYLEELTMKEIGAILSITESRVSQIRTQALFHLRISLTDK